MKWPIMLRSTHDAIVKEMWDRRWDWNNKHISFLSTEWTKRMREVRGANKGIARLQRKLKAARAVIATKTGEGK